MTAKDWPRLLISMAILLAFLGALAFRYSPGLEETLKAVVMLAVGYWLGSSKGSADKSDQIERLENDRPTGQPEDPVNTKEAEE